MEGDTVICLLFRTVDYLLWYAVAKLFHLLVLLRDDQHICGVCCQQQSRNLADMHNDQVAGSRFRAHSRSRIALFTCSKYLWDWGYKVWLLAVPHQWGGGVVARGPKAVWSVIPTADLRKIPLEGSELVAWLYSQDVGVRKLKRG